MRRASQALKNVDLDIRRGEIFALLGPQRRRQDDADQHHLRHRQSTSGKVLVDGHDIVTDYRARAR
jgi:ABC-2 type transport system ATP-binding protein